MNYTKGEWIADIRVGMVAVHIEDKEKFNCLDGMRDECLYYAHGYRDHTGTWQVSPETVANANLIAASPDMYEALKLFDDYLTAAYPSNMKLRQAAAAMEKALAKAEGKEVTREDGKWVFHYTIGEEGQ